MAKTIPDGFYSGPRITRNPPPSIGSTLYPKCLAQSPRRAQIQSPGEAKLQCPARKLPCLAPNPVEAKSPEEDKFKSPVEAASKAHNPSGAETMFEPIVMITELTTDPKTLAKVKLTSEWP